MRTTHALVLEMRTAPPTPWCTVLGVKAPLNLKLRLPPTTQVTWRRSAEKPGVLSREQSTLPRGSTATEWNLFTQVPTHVAGPENHRLQTTKSLSADRFLIST